jgi:hypothetical protein
MCTAVEVPKREHDTPSWTEQSEKGETNRTQPRCHPEQSEGPMKLAGSATAASITTCQSKDALVEG